MFQRGRLVKIGDVSRGADSGWRAINETQKAWLRKQFRMGRYGQTIHTNPSLALVQGNDALCDDGLLKLNDGKTFFDAMHDEELKYKKYLAQQSQSAEAASSRDADSDDEDGLPYDAPEMAPLVDALAKGVSVGEADYPRLDADLVCAFNAEAHDEMSNRYAPTTIKQLVDVVARVQGKVPGGGWPAVTKRLAEIYGAGRGKFVLQMVTYAQHLPAAIVDLLEQKQIPNTWVRDNVYFTGSGAAGPKKLLARGMKRVIEQASDDVAAKVSLNKTKFEEEYCAIVKKGEDYINRVSKKYGPRLIATSPFAAVEMFLMSPRGRQAMLACVRNHRPFDSVTTEARGIEECIILITELEKAKNFADAAAAAPDPNGTPSLAFGASSAGAAGPTGAIAVETLTVGAEEADPRIAETMGRVDATMSKFHTFGLGDVGALVDCLLARVGPSDKVAILVDVPTAKMTVAQHMLDVASTVVTKCRNVLPPSDIYLVATAGSRLTFANGVLNKLDSLGLGFNSFLAMLTKGELQTASRRPGFTIIGTVSKGGVPTMCPAYSVKPRAEEALRLRCRDPACPLRPEDERKRLTAMLSQAAGTQTPPPPAVELDGDDCEDQGGAMDAQEEDAPPPTPEEIQAEEAEKAAILEALGGPAAILAHEYIIDIWVHAQGARRANG